MMPGMSLSQTSAATSGATSRGPNALLSRGVAGVAGRMQVYTLPGSVKAVDEYTGEILKTLKHLLLMLHGMDVH